MIHVKHIRRKKIFILVDFIIICCSIYIAMLIRTNIELPFFSGLLPSNAIEQNISFIFSTAILGIIFCVSGYLTGLYDLWNSPGFTTWMQKLSIPNILIATIAFSYLYLNKKFLFPSSYLITILGVNFLLSILWRIFYFKLFDNEISEIILVGDFQKCVQFSQEFNKEPFINRVKICAIFCPNESSQNNISVKNLNEFDTYSRHFPYTSVIIVSTSSHTQEKIYSSVFKAARRGVQVYTVPNHYEILLGRLKHIHVNDLPLLELKLENTVSIYLRLKRIIDFFFSLFLLIILIIPIILISIIVKFSSPGPIMYKQQRIGKNGKTFQIIKFRSMIHNAEKNTGEVLASKNDPRITKFGKFMRKTRLDEIPQLINIFKGEMSFIGPRPERPCFVKKFENEILAYSERTRIRPGITGLAQIHGDYNSSADTKLKYDLAYLVNQGFLLDLEIIFKTIKVIILRRGQ